MNCKSCMRGQVSTHKTAYVMWSSRRPKSRPCTPGYIQWASHAGTAAALMVHHGRLYHYAKSDRDRVGEAVLEIRVEKARIVAWSTKMIGIIENTCSEITSAVNASLPQQMATSGAEVPPSGLSGLPLVFIGGVNPLSGHTHDSIASGKMFVLALWKKRLQAMLADSLAMLSDIPDVDGQA